MIRGLLRYVYRNLLPLQIKSYLDLFKNLRNNSYESLNEKNILVLSPHPDDDIIGCGSTLHRYHKKGTTITVVYMTDGGLGHPSYNRNDLVITRKEEAERAAKIIGINRLIFLKNKDTELSSSPNTVNELSIILNDIKPEAIFLPFFTDNHADHIATNEIFLSASKKYNKNMMCYGYEIWTPLMSPNCIVDITSFLDVKKHALEQHQSQISQSPIIEAAIGLARYRGVLHSLQDRYAEAFFQCSLSEYRHLSEIADYKYHANIGDPQWKT